MDKYILPYEEPHISKLLNISGPTYQAEYYFLEIFKQTSKLIIPTVSVFCDYYFLEYGFKLQNNQNKIQVLQSVKQKLFETPYGEKLKELAKCYLKNTQTIRNTALNRLVKKDLLTRFPEGYFDLDGHYLENGVCYQLNVKYMTSNLPSTLEDF